jgi:hypothetical protein
MEERTTPVLQASVTNHCTSHTSSINGFKMENGRTCMYVSVGLSVKVPSYNNTNIIHNEIS